MLVIVYRTEIKAKTSFSWVDTSNMPIGITCIHIEINVSGNIMNLSLIWILWT